MKNAVLFLAIAFGAATALSRGVNKWEETSVQKAVSDVLRNDNAHTFGDRRGLEDQLQKAVISVVGADAFQGQRSAGGERGAVFLYHFRPVIPIGWFDSHADIPERPGIVVQGSQVQVDALVANVWWTRKKLWVQEEDASTTWAVLVDPEQVTSLYEINNKPWVEKDETRYRDQPWTLIQEFQ